MDKSQADGQGWKSRWIRKARVSAKRGKHRYERYKARLDPECQPTYSKYQGWVT